MPEQSRSESQEEVKEQRVSSNFERQKEIIEKVAAEMNLDIHCEPSKEVAPPFVDVVFNSTDEDVERFIERVRELDMRELDK